VQNGIPVAFSTATGGSVNPLTGFTASGIASTTFTPPLLPGTYQACATVDNQDVSSDIVYDAMVIFMPVISR
jgi:hypothetical protein